MQKVKIISGAYGQKINGRTVLRMKGSVIELDDTEAQRLIAIKAAEPFAEAVATTAETVSKVEAVSNSTDEENASESDSEAVSDKPVYSTDTGINKLKALLKEYDLPYRVGMTKADIVAELDEYFNYEDAPELSAETPE